MQLRRVTITLLILYAGLTAFHIIFILLGNTPMAWFTPMLSLLAFIFAVLHAIQNLGWKAALILLGTTFLVSLTFESIGVATGAVYGAYHYTDKLGWKFLDLVPILIPIVWFMMSYPSFVIINRLLPPTWPVWGWRLGVAAGGAIIMTAWDVGMDPLMSGGGHWIWDQAGEFFGIPLQNYWGWWLTVFVAFLIFVLFIRHNPNRPEPLSKSFRFERLAVFSYIVTGLSTFFANLLFGLEGPALAGLFAMLPWMALGLI